MSLRGFQKQIWCLLPSLLCILACGSASASVLTQANITVDGNMTDWSVILANPVNYQTDPQGSSAPSTDRDAFMVASEDLRGFAYTWNLNDLFLYVRREGASSGLHRVLFYIDLDNDGVMQSSDQVLYIRWSSSSHSVDVHPYMPMAPLGDAMVDGSGLADGYTLPGTVGVSTFSLSGSGQAANGLELELSVPWSSLNTAAASAVQVHVSITKSNNIPAAIEDNMGATGGGPLGIGLEQMALTPDRTSMASGASTVVYVHQLKSVGTNPGIAEFSTAWSCTGTPLVSIWEDLNANNLVDPGIDSQLADSNGDGAVDRPMAPAESLTVLVQSVLPTGVVAGSSCALTVTVHPRGLPACSSSVTDTNIYPTVAVTLLKSADRAVVNPGEVITYTTIYTNTGVDSTYVVVVDDSVPTNTTYIPGSASGSGVTLSFSHDSGNNWDTNEVAPVTDVRWSRTQPLAAGGNGTVVFQVRVN